MFRTLYELESIASPFVWRSKFSLAHKGLVYEARQTAFTDIANVLGGRYKTVPILVDEDGTEINDSLSILSYLEDTYTDAPSLFGPAGHTRAAEIDDLLGKTGFLQFFPLYIRDIWSCLPEKDAAYFRSSREARFGATLENLSTGREGRLDAARKALDPLRNELAKADWFSGETPGYSDYMVLAFFAWLKSCAQTPPLAKGDPLVDYIERGFALYDGLGNSVKGGPIAG